MNWFKRLCLFVFGLAGLLALVALSLTWVGPWTEQARGLMFDHMWYFVTLEVLVCVAGFGLLCCVLVSLFSPRNPRETMIAEVDGGKITVTRAAIQSQAKHIVEADGTCVATSVGVKVRKRGHVRVHLRVRPHKPIDVVERGQILHAQLEEGLSYVCGDTVQSIHIVFAEPEMPDLAPIHVSVEDEPVAEETQSPASSNVSITVPMGARAEGDKGEQAAEAAVPEAHEDALVPAEEPAVEDAPASDEPSEDASSESADETATVVEGV